MQEKELQLQNQRCVCFQSLRKESHLHSGCDQSWNPLYQCGNNWPLESISAEIADTGCAELKGMTYEIRYPNEVWPAFVILDGETARRKYVDSLSKVQHIGTSSNVSVGRVIEDAL